MFNNVHTLSDEDLIRRYRQGDPEAFNLLWLGQKQKRTGYHARLSRYLATQFPNIREADRENLVQEVALTAATSSRYDPDQSFRPWIVKVTRNKALDFLRLKSLGEQPGHLDAEGQSPDPADHRSAAPAADDIERADRAYAAIEQLPPRERDILLLSLNGVCNNDVAAMVGLTAAQCSTYRSKALARLEPIMQPNAPESADSMEPTSAEFFRRLQERHEHELSLAMERMQRYALQFDSEGRLAGFTALERRKDFDAIREQLRGVLPLYLLRQSIDPQHAQGFFEYVLSQLDRLEEQLATAAPSHATNLPRFRERLAGHLQDYCREHRLQPRALTEREFLQSLLQRENEGLAWVPQMKAWLSQQTIATIDDLVDPLKWPQTLTEQRSFGRRMQQLYDALRAVLAQERQLLDAPQR